ncbi:hypothetical protein [Pseudoalteromonas sp.]|uniref:hypothetical protein n=1 Tax=Pseudoalteromonas sp. TaxID=53249 RepID=UPI0035674A84
MKKLFSVRNWDAFQHYKDRNPPWIKLHNHLLDDYDFECLPDATKCHLLCIWMLASRTNNKMMYDNSWVKRKIGANSSVDLDSLLAAGFIEVQGKGQGASKVLVLEEERREETEENAINDRFSEFWDLYDKKVDSTKCKAKFSKLNESEIDLLFTKLPAYIKSTPDKQYRKNPITWLNGKCWNDDIENASTSQAYVPKGFSQ